MNIKDRRNENPVGEKSIFNHTQKIHESDRNLYLWWCHFHITLVFSKGCGTFSALFKILFINKKIKEIKALIILWKGDRKCIHIDRDNDREREMRGERIYVYTVE